MSAGEQEQIYFATRLALADVLSPASGRLLVLDDPLVDTDADRLSPGAGAHRRTDAAACNS